MALEGLRGIASLTVAIGHFTFVFLPYLGTMFTPTPGAQPQSWFEVVASYPPFTLLFSAEAAVCIFFVMSGYVLTLKAFQTGRIEDLQAAAAKRYVRLAIPVAASIVFAWILLKTGLIITEHGTEIGVAGWVPSWYREKFNILQLMWNALAGAPLFGNVALNPPAWTIQVELIGSILLFAMLATFQKRPVLLILWALFFSNILGFRAVNALFYISFFAGAFLNLARDWLRAHQAVSMGFIIIGLIGVAYNLSPAFDWVRLVTVPDLHPVGPNFRTNPRMFWNTVGAVALVAGVIGHADVDRLLSTQVPVFLGKVSFSLYLIHMPILMSLALWVVWVARLGGVNYHLAVLAAFAVYLSVAIIAASMFHRFIDQPCIKLASWAANPKKARAVSSRTAELPQTV